MVITTDIYKEIRQLYLIEKLSQRQIAKRLHISRTTVAKYCDGSCYPGIRADYHRAATVITPEVVGFIQNCLLLDQQERNLKQHHTAHRIYTRLAEERGFKGSESNIRKLVLHLRGTLHDAYVPLAFDAGEAMQIDWGTYEVMMNGQKTQINAFCARLCFSCAPFIICFHRQNTEAFLEGIQAALEFFGGAARRVIFDNARVAVKEGYGKKAIAQDAYERFSSHYGFDTVFCNPACGNEKGLVENLVGWGRRNFFVPRPETVDLDTLNDRLRQECLAYAAGHIVTGRKVSIEKLFHIEQEHLLPLPGRRYDTSRTVPCRVSANGMVHFDTNSYSVPIERIGQDVTVKSYAERIDIYWGEKVLASHPRNYGHNEETLTLAHYLPLLKRKPRSILQARPVKENLSPGTLTWLNQTHFAAQELIAILTDCTEQGEDYVMSHRERYLTQQKRPVCIADKVVVPTIDLSLYDHLVSEGGSASCQTAG